MVMGLIIIWCVRNMGIACAHYIFQNKGFQQVQANKEAGGWKFISTHFFLSLYVLQRTKNKKDVELFIFIVLTCS